MMSSTRIKGIAAGSVAVILLIILVWFIGHILPLEPRQSQNKVDASTLTGYPIALDAADIRETIEVPFGEVTHVPELTAGKRFGFSDSYWDENEDQREILEAAGTFQYTCPPFDVSVEDARAVTEDAFSEWYPDYDEIRYITHSSSQPGMVFLVDLNVVNGGDQDMILPRLCLAGEDIRVEPGSVLGGATIDALALSAVYGIENHDRTLKMKALPEDWNVVRANESKKITLPFVVLEGSFKSEEAYQDIDLSQGYLDIADMDPLTLYRFRLG